FALLLLALGGGALFVLLHLLALFGNLRVALASRGGLGQSPNDGRLKRAIGPLEPIFDPDAHAKGARIQPPCACAVRRGLGCRCCLTCRTGSLRCGRSFALDGWSDGVRR